MSRDVRKGSQQKDRSFLSRWSARKNSIAKGESVPDESFSEIQDDLIEAEDEDAALTDEELLNKYELIDPKEINDENGLSCFLEGNIPERLRQMALRRLWKLNPLFGHVCDMVEYGEDYTDAATVIEGMQTAYQVGKGYNTGPAEPEIGDMEAAADEVNAAETLAKKPKGDESEIAGDEENSDSREKTAVESTPNDKKAGEENAVEHLSEGVYETEIYSNKINDTDDLELNGYILPANDISSLSNEVHYAGTFDDGQRIRERHASDQDGSEQSAPLPAATANVTDLSSAPEKDKKSHLRPSRMSFNYPKNKT